MATTAIVGARAESFWQRMAIGLAIFIMLGFFQFSARGFVDFGTIPIWVHAHALAMVGWLGLLIVQPTLVSRNELARHRQLGWLGAALAAMIVVLGIVTGVAAIAMQRQPPFFTPPFFLALITVEPLVFGAMVVAAIRRRHATDWHRRLMIGATIILLEPALGRLLPMPLMAGWGEWAVMLFQLVAVAIVAAHDRRTLGAVHPATRLTALVVVATHVLIALLALTPPVIALAAQLAGG